MAVAAVAGERFAPKPSASSLELQAPSEPETVEQAVAKAALAALKARSDAEATAWRAKLAEGLRELRRNEHIRAALKISAPGLLETSDDGLEAVTPENVARLHDELARLQEQVEKGGIKPRSLVRAMQTLYLTESAEDSSLFLSTETADEEALRQLTERTEEFAPALAAMRSLAVDREIFDHLRDTLVEEEIEGHTESEGSDLEAELAGRKEAAPVVLPTGWKLEWVKRKKKEMREFVDPWGRRYYNVREVRAALEEWEAMESRKKALAEAAAAREAQVATSNGDAPAVKRVRLRGKVAGSEAPYPEPDQDTLGAGDLEAAFEEALENELAGALDEEAEAEAEAEEEDEEAVASKLGSSSSSSLTLEPELGATFRLKGLMAKPEMNGKEGKLGNFLEETGRWECTLAEDGSKVNVKRANFDVIASPAAASRKRPLAAAPEERSVRARGGGGRGRGRGRGAAAAARGGGRGRAPKMVSVERMAAAPTGGGDAASESD